MRTNPVAVLLMLVAATAIPAAASAAGVDEGKEKAAPAAKSEAAATKKAGVDEPTIGKGFYLEADPGAYFSVGGSKGTSLAAAYLSAIAGYNFNADMALGLALGFGVNNNNAPKKGEAGWLASYMNAMIDVNFSYYFKVYQQLRVPARVYAGVSFMTDQYGEKKNDKDQVIGITEKLSIKPNVGVATGLQYTTWLRNLQVGVELAFYYVILDNIPALAIYPAVKYSF